MKSLIGNTPMIKINYRYNGFIKSIYAKLEYYNLTGSIKDRMVSYILEHSFIKDKQILVEATSGNTGISLSAIGAMKNHKVVIFMPDFVSNERVKIMEMYGAEVHLISRSAGGFKKCLEEAQNYALKHDAFLLNQFSNKLNIEAHYNTTALEILNSLKVGGFVSGVGSGGTIMGVGKRLKENGAKIVALEPFQAPIISTGKIIAEHKIEGIGDDFIPEIFDASIIDDIFLISDMEAINMSKKITRELGIGVGISSGANMLASILLNEEDIGNVVTVFPDDNKKYLSTDLSKDLVGDFISDKIELLNYEVIC